MRREARQRTHLEVLNGSVSSARDVQRLPHMLLQAGNLHGVIRACESVWWCGMLLAVTRAAPTQITPDLERCPGFVAVGPLPLLL